MSARAVQLLAGGLAIGAGILQAADVASPIPLVVLLTAVATYVAGLRLSRR